MSHRRVRLILITNRRAATLAESRESDVNVD